MRSKKTEGESEIFLRVTQGYLIFEMRGKIE
jgi:hypothetical protein